MLSGLEGYSVFNKNSYLMPFRGFCCNLPFLGTRVSPPRRRSCCLIRQLMSNARSSLIYLDFNTFDCHHMGYCLLGVSRGDVDVVFLCWVYELLHLLIVLRHLFFKAGSFQPIPVLILCRELLSLYLNLWVLIFPTSATLVIACFWARVKYSVRRNSLLDIRLILWNLSSSP